jgi:hypothetical protein
MTRQPAIQLGTHLSMAANAKPHFKVYGAQAIHCFHVAMALGAVQPGPLDVGNMVEKNKVGDPVDTHPGNGFFCFVVGLFFEDLRVPGNDIGVAKETFFHGRNPSIRRPLHEGMAEPAIDLFHPRMHAMAEINRLLGTKGAVGVKIIKIEHNYQKNTYHPYPKVPPSRFYLCVF